MAKKGNGEGSIYYSETLNRWVAQFTAGRKDNGKLNRKSVYGKTRKEAKEKMIEALANVQTNSYIDKNDVTLEQLGQIILDNKFKANITGESTYGRSLGTFKHIQNSNISNKKIQEINSFELQNFINSKIEYSNSYIKKMYELLNSIFKEAIKRDYILKNPLINVILPKSDKKKKSVESLTIDEQKKFIEELKDEEVKYKNIFLIALHTGMRIGEILALTPEDINFKNKLIDINNTLTKDINGHTIVGKTTKTYESTRQIPITPILEPILKNSLVNYISNNNNLLFCHLNGKLILPSTINTHFKKVCKNANIQETIKHIERNDKIINLKTSSVNTHMLRHTYATRCIEAGVPAPVLQKLLGHKDISITLNTYTTIFNKFKEDALNNYIKYIENI